MPKTKQIDNYLFIEIEDNSQDFNLIKKDNYKIITYNIKHNNFIEPISIILTNYKDKLKEIIQFAHIDLFNEIKQDWNIPYKNTLIIKLNE